MDLYLIHFPSRLEGSLAHTWKEMERAQQLGLTKYLPLFNCIYYTYLNISSGVIGVSNFPKPQLQTLLKLATVPPAVNQIRLHPYNWAEQSATVDFANQHGIAIEAYSSLTSVSLFL